MAASFGLIELRILIYRLLKLSYFLSNFDWVCGRLHDILRACISDSTGPFKSPPWDNTAVSELCSNIIYNCFVVFASESRVMQTYFYFPFSVFMLVT